VLIDSRMADAAGIGTYIVNLVPLVAAALPTVAFTLLGKPERLASLGLLNPPNVRAVRYERRLYGPAEWLGPSIGQPVDLLWVPHFNTPLFGGGKLLVTVHDTFHLAMPHLMTNRPQAAYARLRYRLMRARADRIITVSEFSRSELVRLLGVERERIEVIPLGVDASWRHQSSVEHDAKPYIVFVGSLKPHKNVGTLIEAFRRIADRIPHDLVIIGGEDGMLTADDVLLRSKDRLGGRVRFLGRLDKPDLIERVCGADALVHPSLYEGFGLTPVEAMACGCPTVVSSAASLPEVCGDASLYFDPRSPSELAATLLRLLTDSDLRDVLITRGRVRAGGYDWHNTAQRTASVIQSMLPAQSMGVA